MELNLDDHLRKAYAMWGRNRVEFNRDGMRTLITFVWNEEQTDWEKSLIKICTDSRRMKSAQSFACKKSETCYELCKGATLKEIVAVIERQARLEIYLHDKTE